MIGHLIYVVKVPCMPSTCYGWRSMESSLRREQRMNTAALHVGAQASNTCRCCVLHLLPTVRIVVAAHYPSHLLASPQHMAWHDQHAPCMQVQRPPYWIRWGIGSQRSCPSVQDAAEAHILLAHQHGEQTEQTSPHFKWCVDRAASSDIQPD